MIFGPEHLSIISFIASAMCGVVGLALFIAPERCAGQLKAFPRSKTIGMALTAISLLWSATLINQMTLGELSKYKNLLYVLTPLSFYLIIKYLEELLAARAFGGLLMLLPTMMIDAARWHPSPSRLVVVTLGYIMVILGIWLVLSPFKFRVWTNWIMQAPVRRSFTAIAFLMLMVLLAATGILTA